jgi:ribose transport system substrate-binding protein
VVGIFALMAGTIAGCGESPRTDSTPTKGSEPQAAAGSREVKRIIILENGNSPFWDAARAGMQDAERQLKLNDAGLRAVLEVNDGSPGGQLEKLQQFNSQSDIAGVGISALDADNAAIAEEMRKLRKRGVHVVTIDSDVNRDTMANARFAFIGSNNLAAGAQLGVCARVLRPEGGGYVTFVGRTGAQNAKERINGFKDGAGSKFTSLDSMGDDTDRNRARENVRNAIQNHGDRLKTLVGIWSYNAPAVTDVVKETGRRKDFTIVVFDAEPITIQEMAAGNVDALMVQNPFQMGFQGVRMLKAMYEKDEKTIHEMLPSTGKPDGDIYDTGLKIVIPDARAAEFKRELFDTNVELIPLGKFKEWLAGYGLDGS